MPRKADASKKVIFEPKTNYRATGIDVDEEEFTDLEDRIEARQSVNPGGAYKSGSLSSDDSRYS
jgi:hypothetical protein